MNNNLQTADYGYAVSAEARNRVLRNTYWLLALSLVPSVLGAAIGYKIGFLVGTNPWVATIIFLVGAFGLMFAIEKTKESAVGVVLLLAFTFFMGLMLARMLTWVMFYSNGAQLIAMAFGGTALIFFAMASVATVIKRDISWLGKFLFVGLVMLIVASLANMFFHSSVMSITLSVLAIGLFSAYILYDVKRVIDGGETNYITATLAIYLDIYNIFANLLYLLGIFGGDD